METSGAHTFGHFGGSSTSSVTHTNNLVEGAEHTIGVTWCDTCHMCKMIEHDTLLRCIRDHSLLEAIVEKGLQKVDKG